jgi:hypothetical protein
MISMVRMFKQFFGVAVLALGVQQAGASAFLGPFETYQVPVLTYQVGGDLGGPHNYDEEFRRNTPVMYYAMDANFLNYFGANGSNSIFQAFDIYNGLSNNLSTVDLSLIPTEVQGVNYVAQALELTDVKSVMMSLIAENLGLAEPERYVWCLHDREMGTPCPDAGIYTVIQRNFDTEFSNPNALQTSSYVNGTFYGYQIVEFCTGTPFLADAVEVQADLLANTFTAVASFGFDLNGGYYTGLSRDDVGGLRHLLRAGNMNIEAAGDDTITFITNNTPQLLFTSNLTELATAALTNNAAALSALFPNLQILSTVTIFTNVVTTNAVTYFTNSPFAPANSPAQLVTTTVITTNVTTHFRHQFGNVITNRHSTTGLVTVLTTNISASACGPFAPANLICSTITSSTVLTNGVFGDYYLIPTNSCGVSIVSTQLIVNVAVTNLPSIATNAPGVSNIFNQAFSQSVIYNFNQYIFQILPVTCPENTVGLRQGVERIRFEKRDFDSLLNRFFYPVTNTYVLNTITNNTLYPQTVQRVIINPDYLITAEDLAEGTPGNNLSGAFIVARSLGFDSTNANPNLAGPGVLTPGNVFTFNKVGPIYFNPGTFFLFNTNFNTGFSDATHSLILRWGSFDGTTNAPVVYPNGTDLTNLENSVFITVSPTNPILAGGSVGLSYSNQFAVVSGATPPYAWQVPFASAGLPPGLILNYTTGTLTGTPTTSGTYDFDIRMTDSAGRYVERSYELTISP